MQICELTSKFVQYSKIQSANAFLRRSGPNHGHYRERQWSELNNKYLLSQLMIILFSGCIQVGWPPNYHSAVGHWDKITPSGAAMVFAVQYRISVQKSFQIQLSWNLVCPQLITQTVVLRFCTEHDRITAVLCAKFQNYWATETNVMDERDFARFEFKISFECSSFIAQPPARSGLSIKRVSLTT